MLHNKLSFRSVNPKLLAFVLACILFVGFCIYHFMLKPGIFIQNVTPQFAHSFLIPKRNTDKVDLYLVVQTGAGESGETPGMLHYAEHLAWLGALGTKERPADRHSNAWTSYHSVVYKLSGHRKDLPQYIESAMRVMSPVDIDDQFALEERDIVAREYDLRITDDINGRVYWGMNAFLYEDHYLAQSILGEPEDILNFDLAETKDLIAKTHRPDNTALIVIGDVSKSELSRLTSKWPAVQPLTFSPPQISDFKIAKTEMNFTQSGVAPRLLVRKLVKLERPVPFDKLETQSFILADILETNLAGGLAGPLRYDNFIARSFDVFIQPVDQQHVEFIFSGFPDEGVNLTQLYDAFISAFEDVAQKDIPKSTYNRVYDRFEGFGPNWYNSEHVEEWVADYVLKRVSTQRLPLDKAQIKSLNRDIKYADINDLLRQVSASGREAIAYIGDQIDETSQFLEKEQ